MNDAAIVRMQECCLELQGLYAEQLAELGQQGPDFERIAELSLRSEALLGAMPLPADVVGAAPAVHATLIAAAEQANTLLSRVRAVLELQRDQLVREQARAEQSLGAVRAYQTSAPPEPRFLDHRS